MERGVRPAEARAGVEASDEQLVDDLGPGQAEAAGERGDARAVRQAVAARASMPNRARYQASAGSKLARLRRAGLRQLELAEQIGVPVRRYRAVERYVPGRPLDLRVLVNASRVLDVELAAVLEDDWLTWWPLDSLQAPVVS